MKLHTMTETENTIESLGSNKQLRIVVKYKNRKALTILANVLPPSASRDNKECAVFQVWGEHGELCERIIIPKSKKQEGKYKGSQREMDDEAHDLAMNS
ncbi:MAG: hypothetical protein QGH82_06865 [Candidatus Woesearchaeota archaeon]|jgi:hypothetical protein|nr:hypothetical protein [Candidatus Woesearchaeota archaeon]